MKKTENISLAGYSFVIEEDAYIELGKYLDGIKSAFSGDDNAEEIASDIEERIAELLSEKCLNGMVVDMAMLDAIKQRIGDPETLAQEDAETATEQQQSVENEVHHKKPRKMYRDIDERILGGVCSGLAAYFGCDKALIRILFCVALCLSFLGGSFFIFSCLLYLALWIAMPAARTVEQKCEMKGKPINLSGWKEKDFDLGKEVQEAVDSPAGKTFKRFGGVFLGTLLLFIGCCTLLGGIVLPSMPDIINYHFESFAFEFSDIDEYEHIIVSGISTNQTFWYLITTMVVLMGVWFVYNGIMLLFNLNTPKWKPGLVLFIAWLFSLLAIAAWFVKMITETLPIFA
ncbi:MAG: PspC domain-containing protein [Bacteroidales bacterium]|nr:PspC domain-containing protein [Bacteroidales bacterium]